MPKFRDPKVLLWPLLALMFWSATTMNPSSASAVSLRGSGFHIVSTPLASNEPGFSTRNWVVPTKSPFVVVHEFLRPNSDWGAGHRGIDFESGLGELLVAPHTATIALASLVFAIPTVVLRHPGGTTSVFQPACLESGLATGSKVETGAPFARYCRPDQQTAHCGALPCVHWAFRLDKGVYLNPLRNVGLILPSAPRVLGKVNELSVGS
jgi:murein DD-endopeptidase MepM/ murein hydrolase activator NlpD